MKIYKKISEISFENLLIVFFILMILPFIFLFAFNHPSGDDFNFAENTKIKGFFNAQYINYMNWSGRFTTHGLLSVNPLYFNSMEGYKIVSLLLMIAFFYVLFLLITHVTRNSIKLRERFLLSLSIFFLYLYAMPSISQSFYWLPGSIAYQMGIILIMIFLILYIRLNSINNSLVKIIYTTISSIILISIAGSTELSMMLALMIIGLLIVIRLLTKKKLNWSLIVFTLVLGFASYIVVTAPGNQQRAELFSENRQFFYSLYFSFTLLIKKILSWTFLSPILAITFLLIPLFFKIFNNREKIPVIFFINPFYSLIIFFAFLYAIIFIPVWSLGKDPYSRTLNFIYFVFLIGWFYNVIVLFFYFSKRYNLKIYKIPKYLYALAVVIIAIFLIKKNNVRMAFADLLRGTAYEYNKELNERYNFILQSNSDNCEVVNIENIPRTLFVTDIFTNPNTDLNKMYAHYFNKKSIVLKKSESKP